jgi:hypothetical protein
MASASLPEFYEYEEIDGRKFWGRRNIKQYTYQRVNPITQRLLGIQDRFKRAGKFYFRRSKS